MHEIASLRLQFFKIFWGSMPPTPLEARAFGTRLLSRLLLDPSHLLHNLMRTLHLSTCDKIQKLHMHAGNQKLS